MSGYDAPVVQRYPTIRAGVIHATGPRNGPSSPDLLPYTGGAHDLGVPGEPYVDGDGGKIGHRECAQPFGDAVGGQPSTASSCWWNRRAADRVRPVSAS